MNVDDLTAILVEELGATHEDKIIVLAQNDKKVTLLASTPDGVMPIPKVRALKVTERYLSVKTESGQTFIGRDSVFGVRSEDDGERGASRPGFG